MNRPLALLLLTGLCAGSSWGANERGLWELWERHAAASDDHSAVLADCKAYFDQNSRDPLAVVVRGIAAWHLFRLGKTETAASLLEPALGEASNALDRGAALVAQGWVSRIDRELVKAALQRYYAKEVKYPASLRELTEHPAIKGHTTFPLQDRWGTAWNYRLAGLKGFPGLFGQSYTLESTHLQEHSDLAAMLARPYGLHIQLQPTRVLSVSESKPVVQFSKTVEGDSRGEVLAVALGDSLAGVHLAYVGNAIVVVCDSSCWMVYRRP